MLFGLIKTLLICKLTLGPLFCCCTNVSVGFGREVEGDCCCTEGSNQGTAPNNKDTPADDEDCPCKRNGKLGIVPTFDWQTFQMVSPESSLPVNGHFAFDSTVRLRMRISQVARLSLYGRALLRAFHILIC